MPSDDIFDRFRNKRSKEIPKAKSSKRRASSSPERDSDHRTSPASSRGPYPAHYPTHLPQPYYPHYPSQPVVDDRYDKDISWPTLVEFIADFNEVYSKDKRYVDAEIFDFEGIRKLIEFKKMNTEILRGKPFGLSWGDANALDEYATQTIASLRKRYADRQVGGGY